MEDGDDVTGEEEDADDSNPELGIAGRRSKVHIVTMLSVYNAVISPNTTVHW